MPVLFLDKPFLGTRRIENGVAKEYVWQSHPEVYKRIENYGKGLLKLGLSLQQAVGIYAVNRPEWVRQNRTTFIQCTLYKFYLIDNDRTCLL